jgi:hypothetical protein
MQAGETGMGSSVRIGRPGLVQHDPVRSRFKLPAMAIFERVLLRLLRNPVRRLVTEELCRYSHGNDPNPLYRYRVHGDRARLHIDPLGSSARSRCQRRGCHGANPWVPEVGLRLPPWNDRLSSELMHDRVRAPQISF